MAILTDSSGYTREGYVDLAYDSMRDPRETNMILRYVRTLYIIQ